MTAHGTDGHACNDNDPTCISAAKIRGRNRYLESLDCRLGTIVRQRERGEDAPNEACSCARCRPDAKEY